jgi:hypothetical protein
MPGFEADADEKDGRQREQKQFGVELHDVFLLRVSS